MRIITGILSVLCFNLMLAQQQDTTKDAVVNKELLKQTQQAQAYTYQGNKKLQSNNFNDAEADYRKAISTNPDSGAAKYNLGNAYYNQHSLAEAFDRFKQAAEVTTEKPDKHKAFHNMGNVFMKEKQYDKAVEAYKNALRNNPKDDETRYNLALAKKKRDEQDKQGGDGDDKNKDNKDQNQKDNKNDKKEGDNEKENDKEGDKKDENKEGDGENEKKPEEPKDNEGDKKPEDKKDQKDKNKGGDQPKDKEKKPPKPRPGQLSPQQIKNLLQAMNNEEKKVQQKINAKKAKGARVKNEKDW